MRKYSVMKKTLNEEKKRIIQLMMRINEQAFNDAGEPLMTHQQYRDYSEPAEPEDALSSIANKFLEKHKISKAYLKKESGGLCWWFAKNFSDYLRSKGIDSKIVDMRGSKKGNHMVVKVDDNFVDFTMNQFKEAKIPSLFKKEDYIMFTQFSEFNSWEDRIKAWKMTPKQWNEYEKKLKHPGDQGDYFEQGYSDDDIVNKLCEEYDNTQIVKIPKNQWRDGKTDPTEYSYEHKHIRVRDDYDENEDPAGWMAHEYKHAALDDEGFEDDGLPYPQNSVEREAYISQFKYLKQKGYETLDAAFSIPALSHKKHHRNILQKYWDMA